MSNNEKPLPQAADMNPTVVGQAMQVPQLHATNVQMVGMAWVAQIHLLQTYNVGSQGIEVPTAVVNLSWPLAKALHRILGEGLKVYEEAEGTVSLPKSHELRHKKE